MPRLTKIYTRTGDQGTTALGSRQRVSKDTLRVQAYGSVDELNAVIGWTLTQNLSTESTAALGDIQNTLFHLGSDLAFPEEDKEKSPVPQVEQRHIDSLESLIDTLNDKLKPLENFILPGGSAGAAALHVARTVCRRAEREVVSLSMQEAVSAFSIPYLNRLSDLLFVMARHENDQSGVAEPLWDSRA